VCRRQLLDHEEQAIEHGKQRVHSLLLVNTNVLLLGFVGALSRVVGCAD